LNKLYHEKRTRFCVLTTARSGSTWLATLLDSHPDVKSYEEPFIWREQRSNWREKVPTYYEYKKTRVCFSIFTVFRYVDLITDFRLFPSARVVGFKVMYAHLRHFPGILLKLVISRFKLVHLVRQNFLDIYISREVASQLAILHSNLLDPSSTAEDRRVRIDTDMMLADLKRFKRNSEIFRHFLKLLPIEVLEVSYEELVDTHSQVLEKLGLFLGIAVDSQSLHSGLKRLGSGSYREKIENYGEVHRALIGTDFYRFLEAESPKK